jgi:GTP-binding protein LepA
MVGYIIANIKSLEDTKIGDTITLADNPCTERLPGFKDVKPFVFCSIFPTVADDFSVISDSLNKLKLNDASLTFQPESSLALGSGYRCGFLGLLHLEIIQERLEREFDLDIVTTAPSVEYKFILTSGEEVCVNNPVNYPEVTTISKGFEPYVKVDVLTPEEYVGNIMKVVMDRRGIQLHMHYLDKKRVQLEYEMPLAEIIYDFQDKIKSVSRGYASFDYEFIDYRESKLVKVDLMVNKKKVDALSMIMHKEKCETRARLIVEKLKDNIPRHMFQIPIQATINGNVIARENVKALRKNVTAKCYGGDISRKRKLLDKQKKGKKRMRQIGNVEIPQEAFMSILKTDIE